MRRLSRRARAPLLFLGTALALAPYAACGGDGSTGPDASDAAEVVLSPGALSFEALGQTARLEATVLDADGDEVTDAAIEGSTSDPAVATVDDTGLVTAVGQGTATITATAGSATGQASVTVDQVVTDVSVSPSETTIEIGQTMAFEVFAADANGNQVADATGTWSSGDPAVATVDDDGIVTGEAEGTTTIRARSDDGPSDEATLTVHAP